MGCIAHPIGVELSRVGLASATGLSAEGTMGPLPSLGPMYHEFLTLFVLCHCQAEDMPQELHWYPQELHWFQHNARLMEQTWIQSRAAEDPRPAELSLD